MDRKRIARWVAPVAFLAAITIGALVVRAGLHQGKHHAKAQTTTTTSKKKGHGHGHGPSHVRRYTIQSGDTLASIAAKTGTSVARLEQLNPGIDPTALRVGEKIRVQ
ncbi:MAG TPA: LysM domain-containing protein [Gaiellaceae bacterium]|jgi:LysM repeat protein|nr:LysM domain-containing protein [Gaiellaceae bacterium]